MIRKAREEDIKIINEFGSNLITNFPKKYHLEDYIKNPNYIILVNDTDNRVNAFLIVYQNYDFYELEVIFVSEMDRGHGIASNLMEFFINNYVKEGESIILEVAVNNLNALNLYKKFNFEIINKRQKYYQGTDAYVMKKVK